MKSMGGLGGCQSHPPCPSILTRSLETWVDGERGHMTEEPKSPLGGHSRSLALTGNRGLGLPPCISRAPVSYTPGVGAAALSRLTLPRPPLLPWVPWPVGVEGKEQSGKRANASDGGWSTGTVDAHTGRELARRCGGRPPWGSTGRW